MLSLSPFPTPSPLFLSSIGASYTPTHIVDSITSIVSYASTAWPSANRAIAVPISIITPYHVKRIWWANGGTATGNIDAGIYDAKLNRVASAGSTAQSGTTTLQYVSLDIILPPGNYLLALVASSASATIFAAAPSANTIRELGAWQQATALPLPSTFTPAAIASAFYPVFGITRTASGY